MHGLLHSVVGEIRRRYGERLVRSILPGVTAGAMPLAFRSRPNPSCWRLGARFGPGVGNSVVTLDQSQPSSSATHGARPVIGPCRPLRHDRRRATSARLAQDAKSARRWRPLNCTDAVPTTLRRAMGRRFCCLAASAPLQPSKIWVADRGRRGVVLIGLTAAAAWRRQRPMTSRLQRRRHGSLTHQRDRARDRGNRLGIRPRTVISLGGDRQ